MSSAEVWDRLEELVREQAQAFVQRIWEEEVREFLGLRIPTEVGHLIRSKGATDSEGSGPPVPRKWATRSDRAGHRLQRS